MQIDHEAFMRLAIAEAERARGSTGDNPWVGCVIVDSEGRAFASGHTQGPGEDHAEIAAVRDAEARGFRVAGATMYSTLEPCSFHGRTPACSRVIVERGLGRVVTGMRDPNPRVDGEGARILRDANIEVIEGICERDVRRQLGRWVLTHHPHEPRRRAMSLSASHPTEELIQLIRDAYAIDVREARGVVESLSRDAGQS